MHTEGEHIDYLQDKSILEIRQKFEGQPFRYRFI